MEDTSAAACPPPPLLPWTMDPCRVASLCPLESLVRVLRHLLFIQFCLLFRLHPGRHTGGQQSAHRLISILAALPSPLVARPSTQRPTAAPPSPPARQPRRHLPPHRPRRDPATKQPGKVQSGYLRLKRANNIFERSSRWCSWLFMQAVVFSAELSVRCEIVVIRVGCCHASPRQPSLQAATGNLVGNAGEEPWSQSHVRSGSVCASSASHRWRSRFPGDFQRNALVENTNCKLLRELKRVPVDNKLLLIGAPLQNNLAGLWSLLNFIFPDIFSSHQECSMKLNSRFRSRMWIMSL